MDEDYQIIMIGDCGVGKSALTQQFLKNFFLEDYDPTVDDKYQKQIKVDDQPCNLEIVDTAGQEAYQSLRDQYIRTGNGFILAYSVVDSKSFSSIRGLYNHVLSVKESKTVPCVIVGNKTDLDLPDRIDEEDGKAFAKEIGCTFYETSAKTSENVQSCYVDLVRSIREHNKDAPKEKPKRRGTVRRRGALGKIFQRIRNKN